MEINTKYNLNDRVYHIQNTNKKVVTDCPACGGEGLVILKDNTKHSCPECYGRKTKTQWLPTEWQLTGTKTIGQVRVCVTNLEPDGQFCNMGHYKEGITTQEVEYMAYENGVGSGSIFHEVDLLATADEALDECARRNELAKISTPSEV